MASARLVLARGVLASAPLRMGGAGTSGAHSLASSVVSLVFFIVSFVFNEAWEPRLQTAPHKSPRTALSWAVIPVTTVTFSVTVL